jgi:hypothetical protein
LPARPVELKQDVRSHVASQMAVVKKSFLKGFTAKVLDKDPNRLPALYVGSRIPWSGMHERGGQIAGRMLIPLHGRVGRKRFKAQVAELMRGGNAYFIKNAKGNIVLMAENIKEHDRPLAGFKRRYRKAEGIKRLKRGADIPLPSWCPGALKKRLDVERLVAGVSRAWRRRSRSRSARWIDSWPSEFPSSSRSKGLTRGSNAPSRRPSAVSVSCRPPPRPPAKAAAGMAEVKAGMSAFGDQVATAKTQLLAFLSINWAAGKVQEIVQIADAWNMMSARLKLATAGQREFTVAQAALFDIAQRIGVPIQETATLYGKLQQAVRMLGGEQKDALTITESISQALRLSGASATEAQSSLLQFGQALASGRAARRGIQLRRRKQPPSGAGLGRWSECAHRAAAQAGRRRPPDR